MVFYQPRKGGTDCKMSWWPPRWPQNREMIVLFRKHYLIYEKGLYKKLNNSNDIKTKKKDNMEN